jgi:hypothetical protein
MLEEVVAGVLVNAITAAACRLGIVASGARGREFAEDLAIGRWFDTYRLTERSPELPDMSAEIAARLGEMLSADAIQAVLHELLAARLTDAPEADVNSIRRVFELTLGAAGLDDFATELFSYYDGEICTLVGRLEGAEPSVLRQIRAEALSGRIIAILHAIERHTAALTNPTDTQAEMDFLSRYRRHVAEQHGRLEPPDFERRRRVTIAGLYVPPTIFQVIEAELGLPDREISLWQLADDVDRVVLLGEPGGGKTTAANVLLHHHAVSASGHVPFLVTLREFAAKDPPERSVVGHIEHRLETFYQCPAPPGLVARLLLTGQALVVFDGLDELLDSSRRTEVSSRIEHFCTEYPLTRVLVTSRLVGYDQARLDDRQFARYRIGGFADNQVADYVRKWFGQEEGLEPAEASRWASAFMDESTGVTDLRTNPLMLALMCILYRGEGSLPRTRAEVYEECANLLFRKWDARRRIHVHLRAGHLIEPSLRHLAWWLFTRDQARPAVTERELVDETTAFLHGRGFESESEARDAASEFVDFCNGRMWVFSNTGTTVEGIPLYSFTHRTFMEYFAAAHLAYSCDTPERLARALAQRLARNEWELMGELAVQIKDHTSSGGAQRIYATMLSERRLRSTAARSRLLQFLARCLQSVDPPPQMVRTLTREVLDFIFAGDLDNKDRCLPLCWLLASCTACQSVVENEINAVISAAIESGDRTPCLNALRLAVSLVIGIRGAWGSDGPNLSSDRPLSRFWEEWQNTNARKYSAAIIDAAAYDTGMRNRALWHGLITMDRALGLPGGVTALVKNARMGIFRGQWPGYLPSIVQHLIAEPGKNFADNKERRTTKAIADLTALGRYLTYHPQTPWTSEPADVGPGIFADTTDDDLSPIRLDPTAYLGATATVLIAAESRELGVLPTEGPQQLGPLSAVCPYIGRRWGIECTRRPPDLPVPEHFQQLFREWAETKLDLVGTMQP